MLRPTTACNFSALLSPDGSAPAALASILFDPPEPQNIGKTLRVDNFLPFCLLSSDPFSSLILFLLFSSLLFSSLLSSPLLSSPLLSSSLLFSSLNHSTSAASFVHIIGSLTFEFPSPICPNMVNCYPDASLRGL